MKIHLKIRQRGKRGYDISSVPYKQLQKLAEFNKKRWEVKGDFLVLEGF